jgi:hypothetical protein
VTFGERFPERVAAPAGSAASPVHDADHVTQPVTRKGSERSIGSFSSSSPQELGDRLSFGGRRPAYAFIELGIQA